MTRKTISIDRDAYNILAAEREYSESQSFSDTIKWMRENQRIRTFADLVKHEKELFGPIKRTRNHAKKALLAG